jgi:hypothetical protein
LPSVKTLKELSEVEIPTKHRTTFFTGSSGQKEPRNQVKIALFLKANYTISLNKRTAGMETN